MAVLRRISPEASGIAKRNGRVQMSQWTEAKMSGEPPRRDCSHDNMHLRGERNQARLEADARDEFERDANRTFTEAEWSAMRTRLLEFARILRSWDRKASHSKEVM